MAMNLKTLADKRPHCIRICCIYCALVMCTYAHMMTVGYENLSISFFSAFFQKG